MDRNGSIQFQGGQDGSLPGFGLVRVGDGRFYGVAGSGGATGCGGSGCGTVFELIPSRASGVIWTERTLYSFRGSPSDGASPNAVLTLDSNGVLYGVAGAGGSGCPNQFGCGVVTASQLRWREAMCGGKLFFISSPNNGSCHALDLSQTRGALYGTTITGYGTYAWSSSCRLRLPVEAGPRRFYTASWTAAMEDF